MKRLIDEELSNFFQESLNPFEINEKLSFHFNKSIKPGETLLFFDEIQACPGALRSLRFYYEKMPGLHLATAGSLLEFALSESRKGTGAKRCSLDLLFPAHLTRK